MKRIVKITSLILAVVTLLLLAQMTVIHPLITEAAVLKAGSSGTEVKTIQTKLKNLGYFTSTVDGIYGTKTTAAVKKFQSSYGLTADGVVGTRTAKALGVTLTSSSSGNTGKYTANEIYLLAKCIYAEARGEPYIGKVAVGAVILNRVKSSSFPNSIAGVIYQPYAFTAVADGQINLNPDATCMKAAKDAMGGWDPSYGSIYYYNPSTATSGWIFGRKTVTTIGKHVFAV